MQPLLSTSTRVEAPVIIVKIGDVTFGLYGKQKGQVELFGKYYSSHNVTYPNYIKSLRVTKVNGALNTYNLTLQYAITPGDDPNLIDKVLSKVSKSRYIEFTYGDAMSPSYMYRQEKALITQIKTTPEISSARITYNITAVSTALNLNAGKFSFPKRVNTKPSSVILELLYNNKMGLMDVFYGMRNKSLVLQQGLISMDDRAVDIEAQPNTSPLDYLKYLVNCMSSVNDKANAIDKNLKYILVVHDEVSEVLDGPFFTVDKVLTSTTANTSVDIYNIDIGYPSKDLISQFSLSDDQAYSILYNYANDIQLGDITYRIGDDGKVETLYSPVIARDSTLLKMTEADRTWWSQMTQYPIKASITMKGLLRAIILMSYLRVNVFYYGKKHNSSGLYIVTKQEDNINESGYSTTLSLVRIAGDDTFES